MVLSYLGAVLHVYATIMVHILGMPSDSYLYLTNSRFETINRTVRGFYDLFFGHYIGTPYRKRPLYGVTGTEKRAKIR